MKKFDVTLTGHYEKTISVYADSPEQAAEKVRIILLTPTLSTFPMRILSAAKPTFRTQARAVVKNVPPRMRIQRTAAVRTVRTSARCAEDAVVRTGTKDTSYQALNLVIHRPMETKVACEGMPLIPREKEFVKVCRG